MAGSTVAVPRRSWYGCGSTVEDLPWSSREHHTRGASSSDTKGAIRRTASEERDEVRLNGRGGFAFLLAFGATWTLSGLSTLFLPTDSAALVFLFQGAVGTPLAFALERLLGYPPASRDNSLTPLSILVAMSQLPMLLAAVVVYGLDPVGVPVAMAAIVGGHFLPYTWIHKSNLYVVMGVVVAAVPYALYVLLGDASFYLVGFVVGGALLAFAFVLRARAERIPARA